VVIVKNL